MSELKQRATVNSAKLLSKFFEVDITIKVFGQVVWKFHYPPKNDSEDVSE